MVEDGALAGIDEIFGFHNWPPIPFGRAAVPAGPLLASNAAFFIQLWGRGGHASQPEATIDPVVAAAALVQSAQTLVSRGTAPQDAAVVSVTRLRAGEATNVIPDSAELAGTIRAATTAQVRALYERLQQLAQHIAAAHGCRCELTYEPHYPATVNHSAQAARVAAHLDHLLPAGWSWTRGIPIMGAEDFSYYLEQIPGAYVLLGSGTEGVACEPCHSPRFDFDDRLTPIAARLWCRLAGLEDL
jgi:hippurate hydrolase